MTRMCLDREKMLCVSTADDKRRENGGSPKFLDWEEQVVGSAHAMRVPVPAFAGTPTMVTARMGAGSDAFVAEPYAAGVPGAYSLADGEREPIVVRFQPGKPGGFVGTLVITAMFADGHVESRQVALLGRARDLKASPHGPAAAKESASATPPMDPASDAAHVFMTAGLTKATADAQTELTTMGDNLKAGVNVVAAESATYRKRPDRPPLWEALAKEALLLAVDVVVPKIATKVVDKLAGVVAATHHVPTRELFQHDYWNVEVPGHLGGKMRVNPTNWGKTIDTAIPDVKELEVVRELGKGLGSQLKSLAKGAIEAGVAEEKGASTEPVIQFFEGQRKGVTNMMRDASLLLNQREYSLAPLQETNLGLAVAAMGSFKDAFAAVAAMATETQALATSQAWCAFKARDQLGVEPTKDGREVTKMDAALDWTDHGLVAPTLTNGVLELDVRVENGTPMIMSARLHGVSTHVAERLEKLDLRNANLPIRIVIEDAAFITRDEAGRIRASGALHLIDGEAGLNEEAQAIRGAEHIIAVAFAKPLAKQHVRIQTDDANQTNARKEEAP